MTDTPFLKMRPHDPLLLEVPLESGDYETRADFVSAVVGNLIIDNVGDVFELMVVLENVLFECLGKCRGDMETDRHVVQIILRGLHHRLKEYRAMQRDSTIN